MLVQYNYRIIRVDEGNKVMEIRYTPLEPSGLGEYTVGARLPYVGEPIESVVQMYAPVGVWQHEAYEFDTVSEGYEGSLTCTVG